MDKFDEQNNNIENKSTIYTPGEIKQYLDRFVIGQDDVKIKLASAFYTHLKACEQIDLQGNEKIRTKLPHNNVLLFGPTGCGKTELLRRLAEIANLPFLIVSAPSIVPTGYRGFRMEDVLAEMVNKANGDALLAQKGIIFIDEFDKKAAYDVGESCSSRAYRSEFQHDLLKIIEGADFQLSNDTENVNINTGNMFFVLGGAFTGLNDIIEQRIQKKQTNSVGFTPLRNNVHTIEPNINEVLSCATTDDFVRYGIIQELLGRISVLCHISKLTNEDLVNILAHSDDSILKQFERLFRKMNVQLVFQHDALMAIADKALKLDIGARGLHRVLSNLLLPLIFKLGDKHAHVKVMINKECILGKDAPNISLCKNICNETKERSGLGR